MRESTEPSGTSGRVEGSDLPAHVAQVLEMLQHSDALIGVYDDTETLRYTNRSFREAYFIPEDEVMTWQDLMRRNFAAARGTIIKTDDLEAWIASVRSRRGKLRKRSYESDLHDGRFIWVVETMLPNNWIIYVGTDVTALKPSERMVRLARDEALRSATTDPLTGVSNRRHIIAHLDGLLSDQQSLGDTPIGLGGVACLVDIDHFKAINDTYGHAAGDEALIAFAHAARESIRLRDAFGRVGGEEFLILFPGQALKSARATLQHMRQVVGEMRPIRSAPDHVVTFSGGVTILQPGDNSRIVLSRCDQALYAAKTAGRNCILADDGKDLTG